MAVVATLDVVLRALTKQFDSALARSSRNTKNFAGSLSGLQVAVGGLGGAALFGAAIQSTREFEKQFAKSTAIMGDLSDDMKQSLEAVARTVSRETTFSASQAAEAYFFLASAGLDAKQAMEALPKVARFAEAGTFDLALATDLLTDAQSALGLSSKDVATNIRNLGRVSDVLVKANTLANASVEQFSEALTNKAGAALRQFEIDIEEGVAVLAAFADQGTKGAEAGTALSIVLRDLSTKAIKNKEEFEKFGVAVFDSSGEMNNLGDIVADLEGALAGMSDETEKATLLQLGFSDKSVQFIQALLGMSEKIKKYEMDLKGAAGTTDEIANKAIPDFERALSELGAEMELLADETVGPLLQGLADLLGLLRKFNTFRLDPPSIDPFTGEINPGSGALGLPGRRAGTRQMFMPRPGDAAAIGGANGGDDLNRRQLTELIRVNRNLERQPLLSAANLA